VALDKFSQRDAHFVFDHTWVVHVATNGVELGSCVVFAAERVEPVCSSPHDCRDHCHSFNVGYSGRTTVQAGIGWEGRLHSGPTGFALKTFNQSCFFTTNVGSSTSMDHYIKVISATRGIFAYETLSVSFINSTLELGNFIPELSPDINIGLARSHGKANHESSLDEFVWVMSHDLSVFASAWFRLVSIDHKVGRPSI